MIIAVASRKASPGVTSLTAWLAEHWSEPGVTRLIVEADPSGGTLAARWSSAHGLTWDPGLLTLSTSRAALEASTLEPLTQRLPGGVLVAAAPPAPEQVIGALTRWGDRGAAELAAAEGVRAFVDCGRLTAASPALALARRAALTVLVCRPRLDEVNALVPAVAELTAAGCALGLVCVGSEPYLPAEIANAAGLPLLGVLPVDDRAAAVFDRDGLDSGRPFRRSALAQTAAELTEYVRSRAAEILAVPHPADLGPASVADPRGDETLPGSGVPPAPMAVTVATAVAEPAAESRSDVGLPGPGPTRLSNPVGSTADVDTRWPPPRSGPVAADPAPPPPPGVEPTVSPPPSAPPAAADPAPYPGAALTSPLPAGMSIPPGPGPATPPPPFDAPVSPPPPDASMPPPPADEPAPPGLPETQAAIPVSLAIAAARARAQGQAPPDDTGKAAWPPPPPPDGPVSAPVTGS